MLVYCAFTRDAAIHKHIALARMPVEVTVQHHLVFLVAASYQLLGEVDGGVQQLGRVWPSAVQVTAYHWCSVVPVNDPVWIEHRDNFKNKGVSKQLGGLVVFLEEKFHRTLDEELGVWFSWVHSRSQYDDLFVRLIPRLELLIGSHVCWVRFEPFEINVLKVYICRLYVSCNC